MTGMRLLLIALLFGTVAIGLGSAGIAQTSDPSKWTRRPDTTTKATTAVEALHGGRTLGGLTVAAGVLWVAAVGGAVATCAAYPDGEACSRLDGVGALGTLGFVGMGLLLVALAAIANLNQFNSGYTPSDSDEEGAFDATRITSIITLSAMAGVAGGVMLSGR